MLLRDCFADEIAIDFPSVGLAVERMRDAFLGEPTVDDVIRTELLVSAHEIAGRLSVPVDVPIRGLCTRCGGRGETWSEPCEVCAGTGEAVFHHRVRINLPRGVADGSRFRFRVSSPHAPSVRVEVRVVVPR